MLGGKLIDCHLPLKWYTNRVSFTINGYSHRIELKNWKTDITICIVDVEERIISYNSIFYTVD